MPAGIGFTSVFGFRDYRKFLRAYVQYRKQTSQYSMAQFSKEAGFGSANYAGLILSGKRKLVPADAYRLGRQLKLTEPECRYLFLLVQQNDADEPAERALYREWLEDLRANAPTVSTLKPVDFPELLTHWFVPALVACLHPQKGCTSAVAARLTGLDLPAVEKAMQSLVENGLARSEGAEFFLESTDLMDARFGHHFRFQEFQEAQIQRSLRALKRNQKNTAKFAANTFLLSPEAFRDLTGRIRELLRSVDATQAPGEKAVLVQFNLQLFEFLAGNR